MAGLYLASVAAVIVLTLLLAARGPSGRRGWRRRLVLLVGGWVAVVGVTWPLTRLTLDLAFVFGSQATMVVAIGVWLAAAVRHARGEPGRRGSASGQGGDVR